MKIKWLLQILPVQPAPVSPPRGGKCRVKEINLPWSPAPRDREVKVTAASGTCLRGRRAGPG